MSYFRDQFEKGMKSHLIPILFVAVTSVLISSCKKSDDYLPVPYACNCGSMNWRSSVFQLLDANYILADSTVQLSRRYYITADVQKEGEELTHTISMDLEVPDVGDGIFYIDGTTIEFSATIQERNDNLMIRPYRLYRPTEGVIQVSPAFLGGSEPVSFNLVLKEVDDSGNLVGFEFPFSGSFKVRVGIF